MDKESKSNDIIKYILVCGFMGLLYYGITAIYNKTVSSDEAALFGAIIGWAANSLSAPVNFMFGTSEGSRKKDETISKMQTHENEKV